MSNFIIKLSFDIKIFILFNFEWPSYSAFTVLIVQWTVSICTDVQADHYNSILCGLMEVSI